MKALWSLLKVYPDFYDIVKYKIYMLIKHFDV